MFLEVSMYQPTLHVRTKYLPCQIVEPIILAILIYFTNCNATTTLQTQSDIGDQYHKSIKA
jgi:hypothetical protein